MSNLLNALNWRYATKIFDKNKPIHLDELNQILEATRLSPSSYGMQPYKIVVVKEEKMKQNLVALSYNQKQVFDASYTLVYCAISKFNEPDVDYMINQMATNRGVEIASLSEYKKLIMNKVNTLSEHEMLEWTARQCYIALGNTMTVCATMGIDSCPMEGIDKKAYDEILGLKELGLTAIVALPIGIRNQNDPYLKKAKVRKLMNDFVIYR
jgi:nitroreductase/dihydropteridine reductase